MTDVELPGEPAPCETVCFSGHRPERLPGNGDPNTPEMQPLLAALRRELIAVIERGKNVMMHGCMAGWDIICAEQVLLLKVRFPHVRLISVAPYRAEFFSRENCWTPDWVSRARDVFAQHDTGIKIAGHYRPGIYYERNRVLVDHASELISYWDGCRGGTEYTVNYARRRGLTICNLCPK